MSHTRVKTEYDVEGSYGGTDKKVLFCHHNHSCDCVTFFDEKGNVESMAFCGWSDNNLWEAVQRLWYPFKNEWGGELKDGVEYYYGDIINHDIEKHLDHADIEDLGFTNIGGYMIKDGKAIFEKDIKRMWLTLDYTPMSYGAVISIKARTSYGSDVFTQVVHTIRIANKSEMVKLLKQLNLNPF